MLKEWVVAALVVASLVCFTLAGISIFDWVRDQPWALGAGAVFVFFVLTVLMRWVLFEGHR